MALPSINNKATSISEPSYLLQGDARNGDASEYGCSETSQLDAFDEIDPAALLESLANYIHPHKERPPPRQPPITSNDHPECLLQADAGADGQDVAPASQDQIKSRSPVKISADRPSNPKIHEGSSRKKRKQRQVEEDSADESFGFIITNKKKRKKNKDTPEQLALEEEIWGPEDYDDFEEDESQEKLEYQRVSGHHARAAGVQSAAALFRRPSAASKKYTRPPMSKLFTSLELHPELFINLQAAAKIYMLDEKHPERADCVGNRGKGDTDLTKIKLFDCVQGFLDDGGWGEKCFGENAPGAGSRKLKWPQMKQKIVSAITPLLRRMVTNERQRLYALQTRAKKPQTKSNKTPKSKFRSTGAPSPLRSLSPANNRSLSPTIDPNLGNYPFDADKVNSSDDTRELLAADYHTPKASTPNETPESDGPKYLVNIMQGTRRIKPESMLSSCPRLSTLFDHIKTICADDNLSVSAVKLLTHDGLRHTQDEGTWQDAVANIMDVEWMNGVIKCIVEVEEHSEDV